MKTNYLEDISEEMMEAKIQKGWDDMVAGRVSPAHQVFKEIRERHKSDNLSRRYNYSSGN